MTFLGNNRVAENPKAVAEYKSGKVGPFNFLVGQIMKTIRGKANPQVVNELLKEALDITDIEPQCITAG